MLRWISLEPPPSDTPWRDRRGRAELGAGGRRRPPATPTAERPASSRPISVRRITLVAPNSFMIEPAGGGIAPVGHALGDPAHELAGDQLADVRLGHAAGGRGRRRCDRRPGRRRSGSVSAAAAVVADAGRRWCTASRRRRPCARGPAGVMATVHPSSTSPTTSAAGTATSSKNSWQNSIEPSTWRICSTVHAGLVDLHDEHGQAAVLGHVPVGAGQAHRVVAGVRAPSSRSSSR